MKVTSHISEPSYQRMILFLIAICVFAAQFLHSSISHAQTTEGTIAAKLYLGGLRATKTTFSEGLSTGHEDADEIYSVVVGRDPARLGVQVRLPGDDDYYVFREGQLATASDLGNWRNQNGYSVHYPEIWEGELAPGERAGFLVLLMEQDSNFGAAAGLLKLVFGACEGTASAVGEGTDDPKTKGIAKAVAVGCKHAKELAEALPADETHDLIGAFYVTIENADNELQTTYLPASAEAISGVTATTRMVGISEDSFGLTFLEGELVNDEVTFEMTDNNNAGKYTAFVRSERIERKDRYGYHVISNDDLELGRCRGGQSVSVRLADGTFEAVPVGTTFLYRGSQIDGVNYRCGRSNEFEGDLFDRDYERYVVRRTRDTIEYSPLTFVEYAPAPDFARVTAKLASFDLPVGARRMELKLNENTGQRSSPGPILSGAGKCLDVAPHDERRARGQVKVWDCHGGRHQQWRRVGESLVHAGGFCLDAAGHQFQRNGSAVYLWPCHGGPEQKWRQVGDQLVSAAGLCLDLYRHRAHVNGQPVRLWQCTQLSNQSWYTGGAVLNGTGKCLDIHAPDLRRPGAKVQAWDCNGAVQQTWRRDGLAIVNAAGLCLEAQPFTMRQSGGIVRATHCSGASAQQWRSQNARLVNGGGLCLEVDGGRYTKNGAQARVRNCFDTSRQIWAMD